MNGFTVKIFPALFFLLTLPSLHADTNIFAVMTTANEISYTNARIDRVTPVEAIVWYDGGIARVALTNLPADLRKQYPYDPTKAAEFLALEQQKSEADMAVRRERALAEQQRFAALAGNARWINIVDMKGSPPTQYMAVLNGVAMPIHLNNPPAGLDMAIYQYSMDMRSATGGYVSSALANDNFGKAVALQNGRDAADEKPMVKAFDTQMTIGGIPIWQCVAK